MAQKIIGLDLGAHSVKAVVLEATFRGHVLAAFEEVPLAPVAPAGPAAGGQAQPPQPAQSPRAPLNAALAMLATRLTGMRADLSAVALPGAQAATPLVTLPFTDVKKIDATLGFEVEGLIPFDLDEVVYDHQILAQKDGKSELLVGVTRQEEVRGLLEALQAAGFDPRVITLPALAYPPILGALAASRHLPADETVAVLDLGAERTTLVVGAAAGPDKPATVVFCRTFAGGGADLTRALEREFGLSRADAETWKLQQGDVSEMAADPRAATALHRALLPLLREVRQSLRATQARSRRMPSSLHVCGGTARLRGLPALLSRELGVPVELLQPLPPDEAAKVPVGQLPLLAQAYGLAVRASVRGPRHLNLRRGEFAYKGDLDYLKGKVSRLVAFAAVLLLLLGGSVWARMLTLQRAEARLDEALCSVTKDPKVLGKCETDFNVALSKLQGGDTKAAQIPTASAMEILLETTNRMPPDVPLRLQEVEITLQKVRMKGVAESFEGVDQIQTSLKKSSCFGEVKKGKVQKNKDEKIEFTLEVLYTCGQNAEKAG